ncbi:MAG: DUF4402 domain-containing protein [Alphaproteobacteria bacterium]|nr:DUF4402 domain-containing protein [Alphaproteobacteria bacterium]
MAPSPWTTMVYVSAIAVLAVPARISLAAPTINCTQGINFGVILPSCNGSITARATSASGTNNNGCHSLVSGVIRPGICNAVTTLATATMNARITFTTPQVQFSNTTGAGLITLDNYRIQTGGGSATNTHTFNSALLNPTHTFKVGGRLRFDNAETRGTYNSNVGICVTSVP